MGKESQIEKKSVKYAKSVFTGGGYVRKFTAPGRRSVPDHLFLTPAGVVFFIEFKAPGEEPTPAQWREINLIKKNHGNAHWVDNLEDAKKIIDHYLNIEIQ